MKGKGKGNQIIMQIKGDNTQNLKVKEFNVKQLEKVYDEAKQQIPLIPGMYQQSKESLKKTYENANQAIQFDRGRADFHIHAIVANRNDQILFRNRLVEIHDQLMKQNEEYKEDVQKLRFQQQEMENKLKLQIETVIHQLKSLIPFQERRRILIEQKRALESLIFKEKQIHQEELTDIHHKLLDQREYYENDLRTRLEIAKNFAKKFADLHVDLLTKKIAETTSSKRKELYTLEDKLIKELYNIDGLVKTTNYYTKQNQILRKSIENATVQIIKFKQEKKDTEVQMLQAISNHEDELSKIKDSLKEKEDDIVNLKMAKLREENDRLKKEASEAFELMKKAENSRMTNESNSFLGDIKDKSFENDLLQKMKNAADYVIQSLEDKYGATDDPVFLSQKTSMGKLIRRLTLIEREVKKPLDSTMHKFFDTETIGTSENTDLEEEEFLDLRMNVDLNDFENNANELNDINENELLDSNSNGSSEINENEIIDSNSKSSNEIKDMNDEEQLDSKSNNSNEIKDMNEEEQLDSKSNNSNEIKDTNEEEQLDSKSNNSNDSNIIDSENFKVSVEVQTEKPSRLSILKGLKAPPTPPNYPYQFRSQLTNTQSNFNRLKNIDKNRLNYLYYTYANTPVPLEREIINSENGDVDDAAFQHLNQPVSIKGETYVPQPPNVPISIHSKTRTRLRNESLGIESINTQKANSNKYESSYFSRSLTPRRRTIQRHEYAVTPEFKKISNSGRMPSAYIRIIRAPK